MASSADRAALAAVGALALGPSLSGCVSTEQKAARLHVTNARIIASQSPTIVTHVDTDVRITRIAVFHDGPDVAIAVQLRNTTSRPLNDIPISIGMRRRSGARIYLNRAANLDYFKSHMAEIPAGATATWVFTSHRPHRLSGRPFAVAGTQGDPPVTVAQSIPHVRVELASESRQRENRPLRVTVTNLSSVPQVELQVYAVALAAGRYSAAGSTTVGTLGTGQSTTTTIDLVGRSRGAQLQIEALPTLFQ